MARKLARAAQPPQRRVRRNHPTLRISWVCALNPHNPHLGHRLFVGAEHRAEPVRSELNVARDGQTINKQSEVPGRIMVSALDVRPTLPMPSNAGRRSISELRVGTTIGVKTGRGSLADVLRGVKARQGSALLMQDVPQPQFARGSSLSSVRGTKHASRLVKVCFRPVVD